jgi:pilus assembly protein CpaE
VLRNTLFWRPVVISRNPAVCEPLLAMLRQHLPSVERAVIPDFDSTKVLDFVKSVDANVCFIDVSTDELRALSLVRDLSSKELTLIVLHDVTDSGLMLRALRCGAHEFLCQPFEPEPSWAVLDALAGRRRGQSAKELGLVYVVVPSKPNTGSTTIATNIAVRAGREQNGPVLLADLDPLYGSVRFLLKANSAFTCAGALANWARMDEELWAGYTVRHEGIDILLAPDGPGSMVFEAPAPDKLIAFLRSRYSLVFLDTPGLITDWYVQLASAADGVLLVTTNELPAIHIARRSIAALEKADADESKLKLIVNRYLPENGLTCEAIETALRKTVFSTLPNDYAAVQKAVFDGKPLGSESALGEGLDELCRRLLGKDAPSAHQRSWSSLFSLSKSVSSAPVAKPRRRDTILRLGL